MSGTEGEEEEIIIPNPPKKVLGIFPATKDAHLWRRKWSTWLAGVAIVLDNAAVYFIAAPPEWKAGFPQAYGFALLAIGMIVKGVIPLATSIQQKASK